MCLVNEMWGKYNISINLLLVLLLLWVGIKLNSLYELIFELFVDWKREMNLNRIVNGIKLYGNVLSCENVWICEIIIDWRWKNDWIESVRNCDWIENICDLNTLLTSRAESDIVGMP